MTAAIVLTHADVGHIAELLSLGERRPFLLSVAAIDALISKCDILWARLDALHHACAEPEHIPPGAFRPQEA